MAPHKGRGEHPCPRSAGQGGSSTRHRARLRLQAIPRGGAAAKGRKGRGGKQAVARAGSWICGIPPWFTPTTRTCRWGPRSRKNPPWRQKQSQGWGTQICGEARQLKLLTSKTEELCLTRPAEVELLRPHRRRARLRRRHARYRPVPRRRRAHHQPLGELKEGRFQPSVFSERHPRAIEPFGNPGTVLAASGRLRSNTRGGRTRRPLGVRLGELIVQNYIDQRLMDPDAAAVFDKAELAKAIHEEAHAGPGGADHFRQRLLRDLGNWLFRFPRLAEFGHQQKDSRQALLAGVEKLID